MAPNSVSPGWSGVSADRPAAPGEPGVPGPPAGPAGPAGPTGPAGPRLPFAALLADGPLPPEPIPPPAMAVVTSASTAIRPRPVTTYLRFILLLQGWNERFAEATKRRSSSAHRGSDG